jgi:hypothetical protein
VQEIAMKERSTAFTRGLVIVAVAIAFLLTFGSTRASADILSFDLTTANTSGTPPLSAFSGPFVTVTVNQASSTSATITFVSDTKTSGNADCTAGTPCTYLMGDGGTVALNVSGTFTAGPVTENGTYKSTNTPGGNEDGFGSFNLSIDNTDGFSDTATSVSFTLTATGGNTWATAADVLTANSNGADAAAHIFVSSAACTGACSTGYAAGSSGGGTITSTVPEPSSLALLGGMLVLLAKGLRSKVHRNA